MSAPTMTELFAGEIADSNDPTRTALAMLEAVAGHMYDLSQDEPVSEDEGLTSREIDAAGKAMGTAIAVLTNMYARIGKER